MLYKVTAKGKAALEDGTFEKKDKKGRKSTAQRGQVVAAIAKLQDAGGATKASILKAVRFRSPSAKSKANNVGYYLVKLKEAGLISSH
jgi:hypothetical protein